MSWAIVAGGFAIGLVMYFVVIPQASLKFKRANSGVTAPPTAPDHHEAVGTWRVDLAATKARTSDPEFLTKLDQISRVTITLELDVDGTCYTSLQYGTDTAMLAGRWGILDDGDLYMNYSHQDGQRLPLKKIDNAELESPDTLVVMTSEAVTGKPRYMVYRR
ncbi:MAG: hypothetical protein NXI04_28395 [Planctomycetaceae bacterium]|nr:hypothetical protein [Planctomycetaceae bacterium]